MVATARDDSKVFDDAFNTISTLQGISEAVQLQWTSTRPVTRPSRSSIGGAPTYNTIRTLALLKTAC